MSSYGAAQSVNTGTAVRAALQRRLPVLMVLGLGAALGLQYSSAKLAGSHDIAPIGGLFAMQSALFLFFLALIAMAGKLFRPTLKQAGYFAGFTILGNIGPLAGELVIAPHIPAGELALVMGLIPVMTVALVGVLRTESLSRRKIIGVLFGAATGCVILLPDAFAEEFAGLSWTSAAFLIPLSCAVATVFLSRCYPEELDPLQVATGILGLGALITLPAAVIVGDPIGISHYSQTGLWALALLALTAGFEFYLLAAISRYDGAVTASCGDFIAVCAGLGWGYLLFGEIPGFWTIAAAGLCLYSLKFAVGERCLRA